MSTTTRKIEIAITVVLAVISIVSAVGSFFILPYRVTAAEAKIEAVRVEAVFETNKRAEDSKTLARIEERLKAINDKVDLLTHK